MFSPPSFLRKAGIQDRKDSSRPSWTPAFAGVTKETPPRAFRVAGPTAFAEAGITHKEIDHLMIYDAPCSLPGASFAHLPIYGLEDLGFGPRGAVGAFIADRNTAPGATLKLPLNTNGGGLSYMHSGMYGMYALQESVRQMRGIAPAQIPDAHLGLPWRRRHVRRLRHDHHVERAAVRGGAGSAEVTRAGAG